MDVADISFTVFLGLVLGSFATALSYRLPRDVSIVTKTHSQCPSCGHNLGVRDLVPFFSWILLKGRCRYCKAPIGWQYPLIEMATLGLCLLFYAVYGLKPETAAVFALAPLLVSIIDIDLRHKIIPDSLNLAIFFAGVAALAVNATLADHMTAFLLEKGGEAVGGAVLYGLGSLLLRQTAMYIMKREPMGLGDIKFFAAAGFWLGLNLEALAPFMMISGLSGILLAVIWKKLHREAEVPFGPSLIISFISVLCLYPPSFMIM
jgi:leader peptidase (prepilin peptidase)/N-methyltransferase